jgi:hypothetical protein
MNIYRARKVNLPAPEKVADLAARLKKKRPKPEKQIIRYSFDIDKELYNKFVLLCIQKDSSVKKELLKFINRRIKQHSKAKKGSINEQ